MAPVSISSLSVFLACMAIPQVLATPTFARHDARHPGYVRGAWGRHTPRQKACSSSSVVSSTPVAVPASSSVAPAPSSIGSTSFLNGGTSSGDIAAYLTTHNTIRAQYGAVDLVWNETIASAAEKWASGCVFEHSGGSVGPYGENIAAGTGNFTITDGVTAWTNEAKDYDSSNPVPSHFTQVVWKASTQLGCALVTCPAGSIFDASYGTANYIACEYYTQGNVIGEFGENVQASANQPSSSSVVSGPVPSSTPASVPASSSTPASTPSSSQAPAPSSTPAPSSSQISSSFTSSSASPSQSSTKGRTSTGDISAYLTAHNTVRAQHGAVDLTWNEDMATAAASWASGCVFKHSGGSVGPYGENIAAGTGDFTITDGVVAWTNEVKDYDASNPVPSHFTQVVWKDTTELGCALVTCPAGSIFDASYGTSNFIVCEYHNQGNVIGEFPANVQV